MKHDPLEQRAKNAPVRKIPDHWKADILNRAAEEARLRVGAVERMAEVRKQPASAPRNAWLRLWVAYERIFLGWRSWSAVGAAWVVIALIHGVSWGGERVEEARWASEVPLSREARLIFTEQRRAGISAELVSDGEGVQGKRHRSAPATPGKSRQGELRQPTQGDRGEHA